VGTRSKAVSLKRTTSLSRDRLSARVDGNRGTYQPGRGRWAPSHTLLPDRGDNKLNLPDFLAAGRVVRAMAGRYQGENREKQ
jgi:hypothetical protein